MVSHSKNAAKFRDANVRMLAERNPEKLMEFLLQYRDYKDNGGKVDQESFIRSCLADEGGINMVTGDLPAAHAYASQPKMELSSKHFKSVKCQMLAAKDFERCVDLMKEWNDQSEKPGTLASKISQEAYIELHADLNPGQLPWPSDVQEAIAQANKQANQ